jgi:hypothetical protein
MTCTCRYPKTGNEPQHHAAFRQAHGRLPVWPLTVDHVNRDTHDNRTENLRPATHRLQALNQSANSTLGMPRGVQLNSLSRKYQLSKPYRVRMWVDGRRRHLGSFATPEEASAVYEAALAKEIASEEAKSWELFHQQKESVNG